MKAAEKPERRTVPIASIITDAGTQLRAATDGKTVDQYKEDMGRGDEFPPIDVFHNPKTGEIWLSDGFHRLLAAHELGRKEIVANVHQGTLRDARLHAAGANGSHGLQRSNLDKRRAVTIILRDRAYHDWPDKAIATHCHVSNVLVRSLRKELGITGPKLRKDKLGRVFDATKRAETIALKKGRVEDKEAVPAPPLDMDAEEEKRVQSLFRQLSGLTPKALFRVRDHVTGLLALMGAA